MNPRKTLEKIFAGSKNIAFNDMVSLVEAFGFRLTRVKGSHHIFQRPGIREIVNLQEEKGQAIPYQVTQVLKLVDRHGLSLGDKP